ncbi:MAG: Glu/Leu/Phe/Val dehydrogenase [Deltaproteobacteria bacterium]|nr:Glu/Leu/Phe/Val dehydrogenase [Deltaproteobacteria bacterium]
MTYIPEELKVPGYEKVLYFENSSVGLRSIIAIHSTALGPACGGIRVLPYPTKEAALDDVLRLAKGMSYKSAVAGIGFGGGKSVIILDPTKKRPEIFHAFGEFVNMLNGRYISAKDMNVSSPDLLEVKKTTRHVLGIEGVPGSSGDPSPVTARGTFRALQATLEEIAGSRCFTAKKFAIQGLGHVGWDIAEMLVREGAKLWVTDINPSALRRAETQLGAKAVPGDQIYEIECDVFVPCAVGAILNSSTIPRLRCKAVVGCANNQLATDADGMRLNQRGILYAPDFAVNSGGIINIFIEYEGYDQSKALQKADAIYDTMKEIYGRAKKEQLLPVAIANQIAEERLAGRKGYPKTCSAMIK